MKSIDHPEFMEKTRFSHNRREVKHPILLLLILSVVFCAAAWAQESDQISPPLGDVVRQSRTQAVSDKNTPTRAQALVDDMQKEQEAADNAPLGFQNYEAGEYRLLVPFPYSLEGRENGGAVLLGSRLGTTNTEVLAGTPIPIPTYIAEKDLLNFVRQLAGQHGQHPYCSAIKQGDHPAFRCGWQSTPSLIGRQVWGQMEFIVASGSLIPIMCVSPDDIRQCLTSEAAGNRGCDNRYPAWTQMQKARAEIQTRMQDERTTTQVCQEIIYPSVRLKSEIVVHAESIDQSKAKKVVPGEVAADASLAAYGSEQASLAERARQTRQEPHAKAVATLDNAEGSSPAPPGFRSFVLQYCSNPQVCLEASVVIPEKAEVVSRVNGQHIFKVDLDGEPVFLYAGPADVSAPYRSLTDPDYIRMRDLANSNGWSREKADAVSSQQLTIESRAGLMTRFRYQRDQKRWWIGERLLIEDRGAQFMLGCTAPEEHFADAELLCTTLVNSLRLP